MAEGSDTPSLKIDLGFSLESLGPKLSFEIPLHFTKKVDDGRSLAVSSFRIWWHAWRDGKRGIPNYDENELTSFEHSVSRSQYIKIERLDTEAQAMLLRAADQVGMCRPPNFNAHTAVAAAKHSVFGWLTACRGALRIALQNMREAKGDYLIEKAKLEKFVKEKNLTSDMPHSRTSLFDRMGILVLASFWEALLSMILFAEISEFGLAGAAAYGLVISMANVISGLIVGFSATYAFNIQKSRGFIVLSVAIMMIFTVLVIWMNLSVAHFREKSVFGIHSIMPGTALSGVMLVVGLTVWTYAVYKGWNDFEPDHKGHRDVWNVYSSARRREEVARLNFERLTTGMRGSALNELDGIRSRLAGWEADHVRRLDFIRSVIRSVEAIQRRMPDIRANIVSSCDEILKKYRETNFVTRRKSKSPDLKLKYTTNVVMRIDLDIDSVIEDAKTAELSIQENQKEMAIFRGLFESEVAAHLTEEIDRVEAEAEKIKGAS